MEQFCGCCARVTDTDNNKSVTVRIVDRQPTAENGLLDLSEDAFGALEDHTVGIIPIRMEVVPCAVTGNIQYDLYSGSSRWWLGITVLNYRVGVAKLELKSNGGEWVEVERQDYNRFDYNSKVQLPVSLRVTSHDGQVVTDTDILSLLSHQKASIARWS